MLKTEFRCAQCGHGAPAVYRDPSADPEDNNLLPKKGWAREEALLAAQRRLESKAQKALRLRACPSCGARDQKALRRSYLLALLPLLAVLPATFMVSVIAMVLILPRPAAPAAVAMRLPALIGALGCLLFGVLITPHQHRRLLRAADDAVRFS